MPHLAMIASLVLTTLLPAGGFSGNATAARGTPDDLSLAVLVLPITAGFRHYSSPAGIVAIERLGNEHNFAVEAADDAARIASEGLKRFGSVIFLSIACDILNSEQQGAIPAVRRRQRWCASRQ